MKYKIGNKRLARRQCRYIVRSIATPRLIYRGTVADIGKASQAVEGTTRQVDYQVKRLTRSSQNTAFHSPQGLDLGPCISSPRGGFHHWIRHLLGLPQHACHWLRIASVQSFYLICCYSNKWGLSRWTSQRMKVAAPKLLEDMRDKAPFLVTLFFGPVILAYLMALWLIFMLLF